MIWLTLLVWQISFFVKNDEISFLSKFILKVIVLLSGSPTISRIHLRVLPLAGYSGAEVIPGPSQLPAQCRARQLLTGDNLAAPANNLRTLLVCDLRVLVPKR